MTLGTTRTAPLQRALLALFMCCAGAPGALAQAETETGEFVDTPPLVAHTSIVAQAPAANAVGSGVSDISKSEYTRLLEQNTKKVILKLIELERFNLNYKLNVAKQGRWKGWRYLVSQESNSLLCLSGAITGGAERFKNYETPKLLKRNVLENGNNLAIIGQVIGATGAATEFGINVWHDMEARLDGYAPGAARKKVMQLRDSVDTLLDDRKLMIKELKAIYGDVPYVAVAAAEEPVLSDMLDLTLKEFRDYHVSARRTYASQQFLYLMDVARNTTGAMGNRFGWRALRTGDRRNNFTSGVLQNVSGGLTILNPFLSRGVGMAAGEYHKFYLRKLFDGQPATVEKLNQDLATLRATATTPDLEREDKAVDRCAIYDAHETCARKRIDQAAKDLHQSYLTAAENIVSGTIIGGAKVATGVIFDDAGKRFIHNGKRTNCFLAHANLIGICASSYSAFETMRLQVTREYKRHKQKEKGGLPAQIIKARLAKLDEMEKSLALTP